MSSLSCCPDTRVLQCSAISVSLCLCWITIFWWFGGHLLTWLPSIHSLLFLIRTTVFSFGKCFVSSWIMGPTAFVRFLPTSSSLDHDIQACRSHQTVSLKFESWAEGQKSKKCWSLRFPLLKKVSMRSCDTDSALSCFTPVSSKTWFFSFPFHFSNMFLCGLTCSVNFCRLPPKESWLTLKKLWLIL